MFHFIKDTINLQHRYTNIEIRCFSCNEKGHLAKDCEKIHFVAKKEEIIQRYLKKEQNFRKKFKRSKRTKFSARANIPKLAETAEMIQEDYSDYTLSDEEVSQDSLDEILERNLVAIPRAEQTDVNSRKLERKNKSTRHSAIALMGEIITPHYGYQGGRVSYTSQTGTKEDNMTDYHRPSTKVTGLHEFLFFSIDKVENFEVYYPQFNIRTLIQKFEKERFQNLLKSSSGQMKAMVLKNFTSLLKDPNRTGTRSPLFYAALQKQTTVQRGKKKIQAKKSESFTHSGLNKQMQEAITRQKTLKRNQRTKTYDGDSDEIENLYDSNDRGRMDLFADLEGQDGGSGKNKFFASDDADEATVSKREIQEERKKGKTKIQITRLETLKPRTMSQIRLDNSENTSHIFQSSPGRSEALGSAVNTKLNSRNSSKKGTIPHLFQTRNSLDDKLPIDPNILNNSNLEQKLLYALVKEGQNVQNDVNKKYNYGRSCSLEKFDDMKKTLNKLNIPRAIRTLLEYPSQTQANYNYKTAQFGI